MLRVQFLSGLVSNTRTSRAGSLVGQRPQQDRAATLKTAVPAPMPMASVAIGDQRIRRVPPQRAQAVAEILQGRLDERQAAPVVLLFLDLHRSSKLHDRGAPRRVGREPAADVLVGQHRQVRRHLVVEVVVEPARQEAARGFATATTASQVGIGSTAPPASASA